ncbi:MAG TPA: CHAT domain-containing protein [Thermoanaerobaculia bacterium]
MSSSNHPSDETLAAFVDNRLDGPSRKVMIDHIATCDDCRASWEAVCEFTAISEEKPNNVRQGNFNRGRWSALIAVAAAIAMGFLLWPFAQTYRNRDELIQASASRQDRPSWARLSGKHPYRREPVVMRSGERRNEHDSDLMGVYGPLSEIHRAATQHRSVENLRQLAAVQLLAERWDAAVRSADDAVLLDTGTTDVLTAIRISNNARLLNDLAAVHYARATRRNSAETDYGVAFEAAERAWKLSATSEALWNYALTLEGIGQTTEARKAWHEYLRRDSSSEWANEARRHLGRLDGAETRTWEDARRELFAALRRNDVTAACLIVARFPGESRALAEEDFLGAWGDEPTAANLRIVELLAHSLVQSTGDRFVIDALTTIRSAHPDEYQKLAAAHRDYRTARQMSKKQPSQALVSYRRIHGVFAATRSPYAALVRIREAGCIQRQMAYSEALDVIESINVSSLESREYVGLVAEAEWTQAAILVELGLPDRALSAFERALVAFNKIGDRSSEGSVRARAAQAADMMGATEIALKHRFAALRLHSITSLRSQTDVLEEGARGLSANGYAGAAEISFKRLIDLAKASKDPYLSCAGFQWRSLHRAAYGAIAQAKDDLAVAQPYCRSVADAAVRLRLDAMGALVTAAVAGDSPPALENLDRAIADAEKNGSRFQRAVLYGQRARRHLRDGNTDAARTDAARAMADLSQQLSHVRQQDFRTSWLNATRELVGSRIEAELAGGNLDVAFSTMEWHRRQAMVQDASTAAALRLQTVRDALAPHEALLTFHTGRDRLITFAVRDAGAETHTEEVSQAVLESEVRRLLSAIEEENSSETTTIARTLFRRLVQPLRSQLAGATTLIVVPDGPLASIPFALLVDGDRHLVDSFIVRMAPSAGALLNKQPCAVRTHLGSVLITAGTRRLVDGEEALRDPGPEIGAIAALYNSVRVLRDTSATPQAFLTAAASVETVHYIGHAVVNESQPRFSSMALSGGDGRPNFLYAHQIAARDWSGVRVVMLAGCRTGSRDSFTRPTATLAQAFLSAGVSTVIATLWDVEDNASRAAAVEVHTRIREGASPAEAVRQMQIRFMNSTSPEMQSPKTWAAWTVVGGCDAV